MATAPRPPTAGRLLSLLDEATGDYFLVDMGATYSVVPYSSSDTPRGPRIVTADRRPIPCWGRVTRAITARGKVFQVQVLLAAVAFPILGMDFLEAEGLDVSPGPAGQGAHPRPDAHPAPDRVAAHLGVVAET